MLLVISPILASRACGHGLVLEVFSDGESVCLDYFYENGDWAQKAKVEVRDPDSDAIVSKGKTDALGRYCFAWQKGGTLEIVANHVGHRKEVIVNVEALEPPPPPGTVRPAAVPWRELALGLGAIVCLAALLSLVTRKRRGASADSESKIRH